MFHLVKCSYTSVQRFLWFIEEHVYRKLVRDKSLEKRKAEIKGKRKQSHFTNCEILNDWLIFTSCQPAEGYFMPKHKGIVFTVHSYLLFTVIIFSVCVSVCVCARTRAHVSTSAYLIQMFKYIYLTYRWDSNKDYDSVRANQWVITWKSTPYSLWLQNGSLITRRNSVSYPITPSIFCRRLTLCTGYSQRIICTLIMTLREGRSFGLELEKGKKERKFLSYFFFFISTLIFFIFSFSPPTSILVLFLFLILFF